MSSRELSPEWVLSSFISPLAGSQDEISELVVVARRLWPRIQAHARREQPEKNSDEALALATEVWEGVLQSVAKTIQRSNRKDWRIKDTEAYLFGATCQWRYSASISVMLTSGGSINWPGLSA